MKKNSRKDSRSAILLIILLLVIIFVFLFNKTEALLKHDVTNQTAEVGNDGKIGKQVEVIIGNIPGVSLQAFDRSIPTKPSIECEDPQAIARYGGKDVYAKNNAKKIMCYSGYMKLTVLAEKISNSNSSLQTIDYLLDLLKKTSTKLNTTHTVDGLTIVGIPMGKRLSKDIENATNMNILCIQKIPGRTIGNLSYIPDPIFLQDTTGAKSLIVQIQKDTDTLIANLLKKHGDLSIGILSDFKDIKEKIKGGLLPVDQQFITPEIQYAIKNKIALEVNFKLGQQGDKPMKVPTAMNLYKGPYKEGEMTISDATIKGLVIPEGDILQDFRTTIEDRIKDLERQKVFFTTSIQKNKADLKTLEDAGYGCTG